MHIQYLRQICPQMTWRCWQKTQKYNNNNNKAICNLGRQLLAYGTQYSALKKICLVLIWEPRGPILRACAWNAPYWSSGYNQTLVRETCPWWKGSVMTISTKNSTSNKSPRSHQRQAVADHLVMVSSIHSPIISLFKRISLMRRLCKMKSKKN